MKLAKHPAFETLMGLRTLRQFRAAHLRGKSGAPWRRAEVFRLGTDAEEAPGQAEPGGSGTAQMPARQKHSVVP